MLWYINLFLQKTWFSKTNNCSFCNKTTQDFAEFREIWVNFKPKTKTEDEGILRKGKRSSSWFFSLHIGLAGREENQIFCYAKHATIGLLGVEDSNLLCIWLMKLMSYSWVLHIAKVAYFFSSSLPNVEWLILRPLPFFFYQKLFIFRFLENCFWGPNLHNAVG